ncbi:MAG: 7-cyano-7-deazaguanine synthase QueC [Ruminococcus sp.]|nr:7-cyano-7-deazaguanine synthase QueC [Ruminococcus sp.]
MKKALVLLSGGLDSTTALALAVNKYGSENVGALVISYGQKHSKEMQSAKSVTAHYGIEPIFIDVSTVFEGSDCSLLQSSEKDIPTGSYKQQQDGADGKPVSTYVPFRNGLFLANAAAIALSRGYDEIIYGAHSDDAAHNAYPDCSPEFNNAMMTAISTGTGGQLTLTAPFIGINKAAVVKKGLELDVPYEMTWSCYEGGEKPCGKCGTCIDRAAAFKANGIADPLIKEIG